MQRRVTICGVNTATLPKISYKEANELLLKIKNGDPVSKDYFFECNIRLVLSISQRFYNAKESINDIFQVGCIGLLKAIDNFDLSQNVRFSTYAVPMIVGEIKRFLRDNSALRVSRSIRDTAYQVMKSRERLSQNTSEEVSLESVAEDLQIDIKQVFEAMDAITEPLSLNEPAYNSVEGSISMVDNITDKTNNMEKWSVDIDLNNAIDALEPREKEILSLRYFAGITQMQVSEKVGISQAQVSRLEKNALESIKKYME